MILTDTPVKKQIEEEHSRRRVKQQKGNAGSKAIDVETPKSSRKQRRGKEKAKRKCISDNSQCVSCGIQYGITGDPRFKEAWYTCLTCSKWAHESCGNVDPVHFLCLNCMDSD